MARKVSREAYDFIVHEIAGSESMSTDEMVELVRPYYDFDPKSAREREIRRYVGRLARNLRDTDGERILFLNSRTAEIVNIDRCNDYDKVSQIAEQLRTQAKGLYKSSKKACKRQLALSDQVSMFDESEFMRDLFATDQTA
ncbi:MAG: hypothetical protein RR337_11985 [Clostridia bacterium]